MGQEPHEMRQDIEQTRREMGTTLDEIEDRVSPSRIVQRRTDRVRGTVQDVKERLMGAPDDIRSHTYDERGRSPMDQASDGPSSAASSAGETISSAGETVQHAPEAISQRTQGNPLAAGLVAFGVGMLAGSLLPRTEQEHQAALKAKDALQPVAEELSSAGKEMAEDLKGEAQQAVEATKESAAEAAETVKQDTKGAAEQLQGEAKDRTVDVQDEVSRS